MFRRIKLPTSKEKIQIFSDGNDDYEYVLPEYYAESCIDYGQLIKIRESGRVIDKLKRIVFGSPDLSEIETTNIENFNGILRERVGRLVRKTKCHAKRKSCLINSLELLQFYWNVMNPLHGKETPAMKETLTKHIWNWNDFLMYHYAV